MLNISTLYKGQAATATTLEKVRSHALTGLLRAHASMLFINMHGFFEANPAVTSIRLEIHAEGNIDDSGHAYTSYSLYEAGVVVKPDIRQSVAHGFVTVTYDDLGKLQLEDIDPLDAPLANDALVSAIQNRLKDNVYNQDWIESELIWKVGDPEGQDVTLTVSRTQLDKVGDILLERLVDENDRQVFSTEQQIQEAQDEVISWVAYR